MTAAGLPVAILTTATIATLGPLAQTVATVRRFCNRQGVCHQKTQRYLAEQAGLPLTVFNRALHRAAALGIWRVLPRQHCRQRGTIAFNPEHLCVTPEKPSVAAGVCSAQRNTKGKASFRRKTPPLAPQVGGDAELPLDRDVGEQEAPRTEAEPIEATPYAAQGDDPPAAGLNMGYPIVKPAEEQARPYRYRQRQPGDPPKPRRKRRRQLLTENLAIMNAVIARRIAAQQPAGAVHDALPPPPEILPPIAQPRPDDGPLTTLDIGFAYAVQARIARQFAENRVADHDPAGDVLDQRRIA